MIKLRQPSLALHSCDVPGYKYQMWQTWTMPKNASATDIVYWINWAIDHSEELYLHNVVINCHGSPGFLHVGGSGSGFGSASASLFQPLRNKGSLGYIWIIACEVAQNKKNSNIGTSFCSQLAIAAGCPVIAADKIQSVDAWFNYISHPFGSIDDYEGVVYQFSPSGSFEVWEPSSY